MLARNENIPANGTSLNKMKNLSAEIQIIICDKGYPKQNP